MEFIELKSDPADAKGACAIEMVVSKDSVREALEGFYQTVAKSKGLEPSMSWEAIEQTVLASMSAEAFRELKRDFVVNLSVGEGLKRLGLTPALTPKIHVLEYPDADSDYRISLSVVEQPHITLSSYEPVTVKADLLEVSDAGIAARVADVLDHYATYEEAEPAPIGMGDIVKLDIDTQQFDKLVPRLSGKSRLLAMDTDAMPKPFLEGIIGMEVGETRKVEFAVPRDRAISSKDVDRYISTVTFLSQQRKNEVDLTDEWVQEHYPVVGSVADFFEETRKDVAFDIDQVNKDTIAHLANLELEQRMRGDIPDEFYQAACQNLMAKFERELAEQGKTLDDYYEDEQTNEQELSVKMLIQAGESLKQGFALEALFDGRSMALADEDIEKAARQFFGEKASSIAELTRNGRYALAKSMAKRSKAMSWLVDTAIVEPEEA